MSFRPKLPGQVRFSYPSVSASIRPFGNPDCQEIANRPAVAAPLDCQGLLVMLGIASVSGHDRRRLILDPFYCSRSVARSLASLEASLASCPGRKRRLTGAPHPHMQKPSGDCSAPLRGGAGAPDGAARRRGTEGNGEPGTTMPPSCGSPMAENTPSSASSPVTAARAASTLSIERNVVVSTPAFLNTWRLNVPFDSSTGRRRPASRTALASGKTSTAVPVTSPAR